MLLVAAIVGYRLRSVWTASVESVDEQLVRSLVVTRTSIEAWTQRHQAFAAVASGFVGPENGAVERFSHLAQTLAHRQPYDAAWLIGAGDSSLARWSIASHPDTSPPHMPPRAGAMQVTRCGMEFCAYFAEPLSGDSSTIQLVVRLPIGDTTFSQFNPVRATVRSGRTTLFVPIGDSVAVVVTQGGKTDVPRRMLAPADLTPPLKSALAGGSPHDLGASIFGGRVMYAMAPVPATGWVLAREVALEDFVEDYRHVMAISESIVGSLLLLIGVLVDYGFRVRRVRREQQLAAVRSDFVSSVSHELRTPLAQIRMFAELLRNGTLKAPGEADRALAIIERETKRLTILVENILNFTRLQKRAERLEAVPCDVAEEIELVADAFAPLAAERASRVTWTAPPLEADVDSLALRQILINFLENAVKYGPRGQTVQIVGEGDAQSVRVHVIDEGAGVPVEERENIWRAFYRSEEAIRTSEPGSGIGLSVARDLALQYGGRVSVTDGPSGGARFTAEFPRTKRNSSFAHGDPSTRSARPG